MKQTSSVHGVKWLLVQCGHAFSPQCGRPSPPTRPPPSLLRATSQCQDSLRTQVPHGATLSGIATEKVKVSVGGAREGEKGRERGTLEVWVVRGRNRPPLCRPGHEGRCAAPDPQCAASGLLGGTFRPALLGRSVTEPERRAAPSPPWLPSRVAIAFLPRRRGGRK